MISTSDLSNPVQATSNVKPFSSSNTSTGWDTDRLSGLLNTDSLSKKFFTRTSSGDTNRDRDWETA